MVTRVGRWGAGELDAGRQKVQTSNYKINIMYNMINIINMAAYYT